jgi:hypothetical protein
MRMDRATRVLHARGLRVNEECSGLLGCIIKANWWICTQSPRAGRPVAPYSVVTIFGRRSLSDC